MTHDINPNLPPIIVEGTDDKIFIDALKGEHFYGNILNAGGKNNIVKEIKKLYSIRDYPLQFVTVIRDNDWNDNDINILKDTCKNLNIELYDFVLPSDNAGALESILLDYFEQTSEYTCMNNWFLDTQKHNIILKNPLKAKASVLLSTITQDIKGTGNFFAEEIKKKRNEFKEFIENNIDLKNILSHLTIFYRENPK